MRPILILVGLLAASAAAEAPVPLTDVRVATPACEERATVSIERDGTVAITFDGIAARRGESRAACTVEARLRVPSGHAIGAGNAVAATSRASLQAAGDGYFGVLRVAAGPISASDSVTLEIAPDKPDPGKPDPGKAVPPLDQEVALSAALPTRSFCEDSDVFVRVTLTALVSYRLDGTSEPLGRLERLTLPAVTLVPVECPPTNP